MPSLNRQRRTTDLNRRKGKNRDPLPGHAFVHTVIDDHSRVAYAEIHDDERADTAIGVLQRATSWFADRGVALPAWLHFYNHHRPHTSIGKLPPISRISNNLPGHYN